MNGMHRGMLVAAMSAAFAMGCGDIVGGMDAGDGSCTSDTQCSTGKGCHPVTKKCVDSCTGDEDCPASAKTCAAVSSSASKFCTCSTDDLCNGGTAGSLVCNNATKACSAKCSATNACPSGFTCNATSGNCDAEVTTDAGVTCTSSNSQPDVCGHTFACTTANKCEAVVDGTCSNITSATGRTAFTSASTGPVIFNVTDETTNDDAFCTAPAVAFTSTIHAYAAAGSMFGATATGLPAGRYYKVDGTSETLTGKFRPMSGYTQLDGGKMMNLKVTLCADNASNQIQVAFGFDNGNGYCTTIQR